MKQKLLITIIIVFNILFLSGCWNYREVNRLAIVGGLAIDKDEALGGYKLTIEVMKSVPGDTGGGRVQSDIYEIRGKTIFDAVRNFVIKLGRRTYWSHAKVVIIDSNIAEKDIVPVLDWLYRDAGIRRDIYILISKGHTAGELLKTDTGLDDTTSFHLVSILQSQKSIYKYPETELWQVVEVISRKEKSILVPIVQLAEGERKPSEVRGSAIFQGDKVIGYLNEEDTRNVLWINGELKQGLFVVKNIENTNNDITFEVFNNKVKPKVEIDGDNVKVEVKIKTIVNIAELSGELNFQNENIRKRIEESGAEALKKSLTGTVKKLQKDYGKDVFKFSTALEIQQQKTWKKLKPKWEEEFRLAEVNVEVDMHIKGSAVASKAIKGE
ncbi:Ger(x)C family spore germination protein [Clostridium magnum]|uniref:Spore germination protein B3 n=1 Tax=Clostridium magnum DSM 2767 TaxID=1121326 RepID=A0A162QX37_9CLOT|nr:Ger(x)C family spore germination protein [Clostridium magnum]KZL89091.1 spore germination protein B3 precursor [Clostridium magnum DSM 2767]SHI29368.1 spore germination protein KC [Clostridium magnum DSM 2767]